MYRLHTRAGGYNGCLAHIEVGPPIISGMMKAARHDGGMIMAPWPHRFYDGSYLCLVSHLFHERIVKVPTAATLATWLPVIIPKAYLPDACLCRSALNFPKRDIPRSINNCPAPETVRNAPKTINTAITVDDTASAGREFRRY